MSTGVYGSCEGYLSDALEVLGMAAHEAGLRLGIVVAAVTAGVLHFE
jgi:hypothetical protein